MYTCQVCVQGTALTKHWQIWSMMLLMICVTPSSNSFLRKTRLKRWNIVTNTIIFTRMYYRARISTVARRVLSYRLGKFSISQKWQIIDLRDTEKSRYFSITEFNNCFIIQSPSLFLNEYLREAKRSAFFHARTIARRRKVWFRLRMSRILFAAKHSWTTLRMSRPLFVGSYLQATWWAFGQWKRRKICIEW